MGTWADPFHDAGAARRLAEILDGDAPVPASSAGGTFWHLVGDDGLHDLIESYRKAEPAKDMRHAAAAWVAGWLGDGEARWQKPWDREAAAIAAAAVTRWQERHPDQTILPPGYSDYFVGSSAARPN